MQQNAANRSKMQQNTAFLKIGGFSRRILGLS